MTPTDKAAIEESANQSPIEDLERSALSHYKRLSDDAHDWLSSIPKAIRFYYAAKRWPTQPLAWMIQKDGFYWVTKNAREAIPSPNETVVPLYAHTEMSALGNISSPVPTESIHRLLAGETREAVIADAREYEKQHEAAEQSTIKFVKDYIKTLPHTEAVSECLHCSLNYLVSRFIDKHRAFDALLSSPSPHDDAGADKPAGVPDAIKGNEQYPFAWHFGNIKVALETMECTGKLPNGCPNCKGLDFCTKRDALKQYAKMEQCWNFWMEDPHHG